MGRENTPPDDVPRGDGGRWLPGASPNPGGRPKRLAEIEKMLDDEHRTVDQMRETYRVLREVAHGVPKGIYYKGALVATEMQYDAAFMALYLNRIMGPVKESVTEDDLRDAPDAVLEWLSSRN